MCIRDSSVSRWALTLTMSATGMPSVMQMMTLMPASAASKMASAAKAGGTLTYEAVDQITKAGLGQSTAIGIGGDPIIGTTTLEAVQLLMADDETDGIIMIGEIGGDLEVKAARWIAENGTKPVVGFIAGVTAPKGRTMGHAGAIVSGEEESAEAKKAVMRECGIHVVDSPAQIGAKMVEALGVSA